MEITASLLAALETAEAAIEADILKKEVRLARDIWGIARNWRTGTYDMRPEQCVCAVGCYLIGRPSEEDCGSYIRAAARSLGVPQLWVGGLVTGFDGGLLCMPLHLTDNAPVYVLGHAAGIRLAQKYLLNNEEVHAEMT